MRSFARLLVWSSILIVVGDAAALELTERCKTIVRVVDCDDVPVPGATVTATTVSGTPHVAITNANGEAALPICPSQISSIKVLSHEEEGGSVCTSSPCVVKMCYPLEEYGA